MSKCDFSEVASAITLRHGCSPVNLLHIFRPPFLKNTPGRLLLKCSKLVLVAVHCNCLIGYFMIGWISALRLPITAQIMKFSIKDFFSKSGQIRRKLRIWSDLLNKSLMENFIFCAVICICFGWCLEGTHLLHKTE